MANPTVNQVGPSLAADGAVIPVRSGKLGDTIVSGLNGMYFEQAYRGNLFYAHAIVTAPVIFTTAAGTGGPLLWNGTSNKVASIIAVGWGITTAATTTNFALGLTGNSGQTSAPTSTTAIDSRTNAYIGGAASGCTPYRVGTVTNAGGFFIPFGDVHLGALTVDTTLSKWVEIKGGLVVPPSCWASIATSATATAAVISISMMWVENPL